MKIIFLNESNDKINQQVEQGFVDYEKAKGIDFNHKTFCFALYQDDNHFCGALKGYTMFSEIHITELWIDENYRRNGYGSLLLQALETHFQNQGYNNINLTTHTFQAPDFYKKYGFTEEFIRVNKINPQLSKIFFVKFLEDTHQTQGLFQSASL